VTCIISDKGQATSPKDQELANTLRKSYFKGVTLRIYWPTREIKPISEFGNTKKIVWFFLGYILEELETLKKANYLTLKF
jgi:hypothetical protein